MKSEYKYAHAARRRFGSWNNAISAAGFYPRKVKFSHKQISKDGDVCDSVSELIIDDWLYKNGIFHKRNVRYPDGSDFTVDFFIDPYWIEFFGLSGQLKKYDKLMSQKIKFAKRHQLHLIKLYPQDIFPVFKIHEKLGFLLKLKAAHREILL